MKKILLLYVDWENQEIYTQKQFDEKLEERVNHDIEINSWQFENWLNEQYTAWELFSDEVTKKDIKKLYMDYLINELYRAEEYYIYVEEDDLK